MHDWQQIPPADAGFAPDVAEQLAQGAHAGELDNLHGVVVARHGRLVFEHYGEGPDERWGEDIGTVKFGPDVVHDLRSVSKSIVGLLYGIALADGSVPALEQPLVDSFPSYRDLASDPGRRRMTVAHALCMTLGTDWDESLPYDDPRNAEIAMERAPDRYRFILDRRFVSDPGTRWRYCGGATAILAHLIARGTGMPLFDYARERLFAPLGITDAEWVAGTNGEAAAASGLRMRPRDLAKLGRLILDRGRREERQLVPGDWLAQSFEPRVDTGEGLSYGLHWWLGRLTDNDKPWMAGFGNGGQRLFIVPSLDLVVVIAAGNYNRPDHWKLPVTVITKHVLSAIEDR